MIDSIISILSLIGGFIFAGVWNPFEIKNPWILVLVFLGTALVLYVLLAAMYIFISFLISLTINKNKEYDKQSKFHCVYFSQLLEFVVYLMGARIEVKGMDKLPKDKKFLFVSNHISIYDTFVQIAALRKFPIAFISKPENFKIPIGHKFMVRCRYMALDRQDVRSGAKITKKASEMIATGDTCIGVYPEGTRNRTEDTLIEFKPGCFKIAVWAKSPIVVSVVRNTNMIKKNGPFRRTKVVMEILDVLEYEEFKDMTTIEIGEVVREKMLTALEK